MPCLTVTSTKLKRLETHKSSEKVVKCDLPGGNRPAGCPACGKVAKGIVNVTWRCVVSNTLGMLPTIGRGSSGQHCPLGAWRSARDYLCRAGLHPGLFQVAPLVRYLPRAGQPAAETANRHVSLSIPFATLPQAGQLRHMSRPKARPQIALGMWANNRSRPIGPTLPLWGVAVRPRLSTQGCALGFFRSHLWCEHLPQAGQRAAEIANRHV
jgi:hypothetical protein